MVHRGVGCCPKAETQSQDHTLCLKGCSLCGFRKTGGTSFGTDSMGLEGSLRAVVFKLFCKWYSFNSPAYCQIHIAYFSTPLTGRKTRKGPTVVVRERSEQAPRLLCCPCTSRSPLSVPACVCIHIATPSPR